MDNAQRKIGIALSGGGIRAAIFHLGVLKWMAENNMLEDIVRISSVSGASLCVGLVYSHSSHKWPTSTEYLSSVLPRIQKVLLKKDIQIITLRRLFLSPWWWSKKVNFLAKMMQKHWEITGNISDLGKNPLWYINCTTFETGKRFRISQENMGDYQIGYVDDPKLSIDDSIASSAGFPVFIGPYKLRTDKYVWKKSYYSKDDLTHPKDKYIHLWDGGVYDNLGLESVYKFDNGGSFRVKRV
jgi:NTE family protein